MVGTLIAAALGQVTALGIIQAHRTMRKEEFPLIVHAAAAQASAPPGTWWEWCEEVKGKGMGQVRLWDAQMHCLARITVIDYEEFVRVGDELVPRKIESVRDAITLANATRL